MPTLMRNRKWFSLFATLAFLAVAMAASFPFGAAAQSTNASVSGRVTDQQNAVMPDVEVEIRNVDTNVAQVTKTNGDGIYSFPSLRPGNYVMSVRKEQFQTVSVTGITLNVQDNVSRNFSLHVGSSAVSITVTADKNNINTTDAAVSTVVDRQFVANMPLNGRSFQALITLTPGVTEVGGFGNGGDAKTGIGGEITVNGQRTEANYFTVDGVGANTGVAPGGFGSGMNYGGAVPGTTALGSTQSLVSIDALQEFRATTSTYSAEYGRTPGGQFSFLTRSGTNQWHGSAYDYLRNEALDANNWFNNLNAGLFPQNASFYQREKERQNDFGGTLGGPVIIPRLYNGKDKTFFFFSYEGLRLLVPQGVSQSGVPDANFRNTAPTALQPILNSFPLPNGGEDGLNDGLGIYNQSTSFPSTVDSVSVRIDHSITDKFKVFGRFADAPSDTSTYSEALKSTSGFTNRALTLGATNVVNAQQGNELRFNLTQNNGILSSKFTNLGGATPFDISSMPGPSGKPFPAQGQLFFCLCFGTGSSFSWLNFPNAQRQYNVTDTYSWSKNEHSLKFGIDWRRLTTKLPLLPAVNVLFFSEPSLLANSMDAANAFSATPSVLEPVYTNFSAFAQDEWKATRRLSLSLGLRWDVNPAPGNLSGPSPYTVNQTTDLSTTQLAPAGTPLWRTDWHGFAPRLGLAYQLAQASGHETVLRGGFGLFYDLGSANGSQGFSGVGFSSSADYSGSSFPITSAQWQQLPPPSVAPPYNNDVWAFDRDLKLPYTLQWSLALEQAISATQALTVSYVGSSGRRLLTQFGYLPSQLGNLNFSDGNRLVITANRATSSYDALQAQYQKRLSNGLQVLTSYTWSHSIDEASTNIFLTELSRASSTFDIRHNFQAALTYDIPGSYSNSALSAILKHWGLDTRISARSALPVDVVGRGFSINPLTHQQQNFHPDIVAGQPLYLYGPQFPGGRAINYDAFQMAPAGVEGDTPRNYARGFGAWQADLALRRDFPIHERLSLQFRAEAFNLFNHPSFGSIYNFTSYGRFNPSTGFGFGVANSTLNTSLGGLNSLYQIGGPRSLQLALKLQF